MHPSVSGMGMGAVDTAAGLAALELWEPAKYKRLLPKLTLRYYLPSVTGFRQRAPAS